MNDTELKPEIRQRETELKESKDLLRIVLDNSADSIQVLEAIRDAGNNIVDFRWALLNKAAEKALQENVVGRNVLSFNPNIMSSGVFDKFVKVTTTGETLEFELNSQWRGLDYWYHNTAVKLNDGFMLTSVDITQRKKSEREIHQANAFIEKVITTHPDLISINDAKTGLLLYSNNPSFWNLFNKSFEEIKDSRDTDRAEDIVHPDYMDKAKLYLEQRKLLADGEILEIEFKLFNDNWVRSRSKVFQRDENGIASQILSITTNITANKQTEIKLQESKEKMDIILNQFQTLVNNTPDIITRWDKNLNLLFANDAFENKLDVKVTDLIGKRSGEIGLSDRLTTPWDEKLRQAFNSKNPVDHYNIYPNEKGEEHFFTRIVPEFASDGSMQSVLAIAREITDLKKAENELIILKLQQQKDILNAIILTQEQERQRIGEALHNGVAQLLYGMQTRLHLINSKDDSEKLKITELLKIVQDAIHDTRRVSFELVPALLKDYGLKVALQSLFQRIANESLELRLHTNEFTFRLPEKIEFSIYRIVQELVNNILKHAKANRAIIEIILKKKKLTVKVSDNGIGFTDEKLNPMSKGIGLQSVKNRVQLLEGKMKITSTKEGTDIVIDIPLKESA